VSRCATNIVPVTVGVCGLPTRQRSGADQLTRTDQKSFTHGEGSVKLPRTEGSSRPLHTGTAKAAGNWRLGPTVYVMLLSSKRKLSHLSDSTKGVSRMRRYTAYVGSGSAGYDTAANPRWRNSFPRSNVPSRTDCGALGPSCTARHRAGSTTTHRPSKVPRTAREVTY
jgi:hypothetical protein